ncbi:amino acid permease [Rossellomorea vietnamensis]|uniref:Amino acid permease n=1 Tax=Rossellomorea vietnamensis TaxID=218284 RepID=A0A5D4KD75_9BACI|nr:APC family permease [Rossellomorea vietnamensis]TYR75142.1 amino acid permease [Rossellomorea vietnamensis]
MKNGLKRELGKWHGYALMIGGMVGSGIFVVTGEAGAQAGPSVPFGYVVLLPVLLCSALAYLIFMSTPLGNSPGGAYVHISRTFNNYFAGFLFMWFQYIALLGVMAIMAISFGDYLSSVIGAGNTAILATVLLLVFYLLNIVGVKWFGVVQLVMSAVLFIAILVLVVPGVFFIETENFSPMLPNGVSGFIAILPSLFFAYFGFEQLAQAGGEMKDPQKAMPRTMLIGSFATVIIYFLISIVAFGVIPYDQLAQSQSAMFDVASVYLPAGGKWIVMVGIIMAFATTLNSLVMVVSRILFAFAEDRVIPVGIAKVNKRFNTPHIAITINTIIVLGLIWTRTLDYLLNVSLQGMFLMYIGHAIAMMALPFVRPALFQSALIKPKLPLIICCGVFSLSVLVFFSYTLIFSVFKLLLIWSAVGVVIFLFGRIQGKNKQFDYHKQLESAWQQESISQTN